MRPRTTSVGSLPRPRALARARWLHAEGELDDAALAETTTDALRAALARQERLGLDLLVDGQLDRGDMVTDFACALDGVERGGLVRCYGNRYYHMPRVTGPIAGRPEVGVRGWRRARALTERPLKASVTGPYTLMDWSGDEHYESRRDCCRAFSATIAAEVQALVEAGAEEIQLDEPAFPARRAEIDWALEAMGATLRAAAGRARTWAHVGYAQAELPWERLREVPADGVVLRVVDADPATLDGIEALAAEKSIVAGVVDAAVDDVEEAEPLRGRVDALLARVASDRLWLAPDGGLRGLDERAAWAKLEALVRVAADAGR
jgi:5-methyltetrahydropteroyltriglutamate--homocysteine methyltransferase